MGSRSKLPFILIAVLYVTVNQSQTTAYQGDITSSVGHGNAKLIATAASLPADTQDSGKAVQASDYQAANGDESIQVALSMTSEPFLMLLVGLTLLSAATGVKLWLSRK